MNTFIQHLNSAAASMAAWSWEVFWQSSILILLIGIVDFCLRKKLAASVRYALWLLVLAKLLIPPSFASPSGVAWWLRPRPSLGANQHGVLTWWKVASTRSAVTTEPGPPFLSPQPPRRPPIAAAAWLTAGSLLITFAMLGRLAKHRARLAAQIADSRTADRRLQQCLEQTKALLGFHVRIQLRVTHLNASPALCGLLRPSLVLPAALGEELTDIQLRAVFLHELIHSRRLDPWVRVMQSLLQALFWWNPLLWFANARICRLREEAVDDAVMQKLNERSADYPRTLLAVARVCFKQPANLLGLLGMAESSRALRERVERLIRRPQSSRIGFSLLSAASLIVFAGTALPMGHAPLSGSGNVTPRATNFKWPDARYEGYKLISLRSRSLVLHGSRLVSLPDWAPDSGEPTIVFSNQLPALKAELKDLARAAGPAPEPLDFEVFSGGNFNWRIGGTNNCVNYLTESRGLDSVLIGADVDLPAPTPEWLPVRLNVIPQVQEDGSLLCKLKFRGLDAAATLRTAEARVSAGGALLVSLPVKSENKYQYQLILLSRDGLPPHAAAPGLLKSESQKESASAPSPSPPELKREPQIEIRFSVVELTSETNDAKSVHQCIDKVLAGGFLHRVRYFNARDENSEHLCWSARITRSERQALDNALNIGHDDTFGGGALTTLPAREAEFITDASQQPDHPASSDKAASALPDYLALDAWADVATNSAISVHLTPFLGRRMETVRKAALPHILFNQLGRGTVSKIWDGQTIVIGGIGIEKSTESGADSQRKTWRLVFSDALPPGTHQALMLVSVSLIDDKGNLFRKADSALLPVPDFPDESL